MVCHPMETGLDDTILCSIALFTIKDFTGRVHCSSWVIHDGHFKKMKEKKEKNYMAKGEQST